MKKLSYGVNERPPLGHLILLGLQYLCMSFPYLVIVIILSKKAGVDPSTALTASLIALGLAALIQSIKKGPIGSGYLAPSVISAIYLPASLLALKTGGLTLVYSMTFIAGMAECGLSFFLYRLRKWFPPLIPGLIIITVGFELGLLALSQIFSIRQTTAFSLHFQLILAGTTLVVMIILTVWAKGLLRLLAPFIGIAVGFTLASSLHLLPSALGEQIASASWIALPQWQSPKYDFSLHLLVPFVLASLAGSLRTIGAITTCQKINDAGWTQADPSTIKKGVLADGIGCAFAGLIGSPGLNVAPSLIGVSQATGATSRHIAFSLASWLLLFALLPKFIALLSAIPLAIMGAALLYTASFMIGGGIELLTARKFSTRDIFIVGLSLSLGMSHEVFPSFYSHLPSPFSLFLSSSLSIVTLSALLLNALFLIRSKERVFINRKIESERVYQESLNQAAQKISLPQPIIKRIQESASSLLNLLKKGYIKEGFPSLEISHTRTNMLLEFSYQGTLPKLKFEREKDRKLIEETPFALGFSNFSNAIAADEINVLSDNDQCTILLLFNR